MRLLDVALCRSRCCVGVGWKYQPLRFIGRTIGGWCTLVNVLHIGAEGSRRLATDILRSEICCGKMMWTASHLVVCWERRGFRCEANVGGGDNVGSVIMVCY